MKNANPLHKTADSCRHLLTAQRITEDGPGTILRDIQTLIDFIGVQGIVTDSEHGNPPAAVLPELNARLSPPVELNLSRALLRDYPNLAGLLVLLRVMDLAAVKEKRLMIDAASLARWSSLNPTEKYFALLESWLMYGADEVVGIESRRFADQFSGNLRFLALTLTLGWQTFPEWCHKNESAGCVSAWNTQLHMRFGLVEVTPLSLKARRSTTGGWVMEKGRRTPWGEAVAWALTEWLNAKSVEDLLFLDLPEDASFGSFQTVFQPYFPEWQQIWTVIPFEARRGVYVFKVSMDPRRVGRTVWRRIAVPHTYSLDDLAATVLHAFQFDDDEHLYEFSFRDDHGMKHTYNHPSGDEGPWAHEITLGESGLTEKKTMQFWFDFGDDWKFSLHLERIEPTEKGLEKSRVLETKGKPPKQHPDWEEE